MERNKHLYPRTWKGWLALFLLVFFVLIPFVLYVTGHGVDNSGTAHAATTDDTWTADQVDYSRIYSLLEEQAPDNGIYVPDYPLRSSLGLQCGTAKVGGKWTNAGIEMFRATGRVHVCYRRGEGKVAAGDVNWDAHTVGLFGSVYYRFDHWNSGIRYHYNWLHNGPDSGLAIKRGAYFQLCAPGKIVCFRTIGIHLHIYLHSRGTYHHSAVFTG
jgi:hypothetical protein